MNAIYWPPLLSPLSRSPVRPTLRPSSAVEISASHVGFPTVRARCSTSIRTPPYLATDPPVYYGPATHDRTV